jgi:CHAD domain-containing protein
MKRENWSRFWLEACRRRAADAVASVDAQGDPAERVRLLRTLAKDWRALLRLAPPALAGEAKHLRRDVGDVRRSLGEMRRDHMVRRMFARAARDLPDLAIPDPVFAQMAQPTGGNGQGGSGRSRFDSPLDMCRAALVALAARQDAWTLDDHAGAVPKGLRDGILRAYRRGWRHLRHDVASLTLDDIHDLRTATTDLRYQLDFLAPLWPGPIAALAAEAERLRGRLGRIVDLTEARDSLPADADPRLRAALDREEARRRQQAARLATLFFADKPQALRRRLTAWFAA